MAFGFFHLPDFNKGLVVYALAFRAHILGRCAAPSDANDVPAVEALRIAQQFEWHGVEPMPVPVEVYAGNAKGFTVSLTRLQGSFYDDADFNRVLPVAQRSIHSNMFDARADER